MLAADGSGTSFCSFSVLLSNRASELLAQCQSHWPGPVRSNRSATTSRFRPALLVPAAPNQYQPFAGGGTSAVGSVAVPPVTVFRVCLAAP